MCFFAAANCRERWRNIRGSFLRSLKKSSKGNSRKKYYLSEYLEFLRPYVKPKKASDNEDSDTQETTTDNQSNSFSNQYEEFDDSKSQIFHQAELLDPATNNMMLAGDFYGSYDQPSSSKKRRTECTDADDTFAECIKNMVERNNVERDDPNMLFLRSLLPDIMKMTDRQNLKFRLKVLELIDGILGENETKSQELPSHSSY